MFFKFCARFLSPRRRWHRFGVERNQDRQWKPLSGPASSGERALGLTVPLFAAASSHYLRLRLRARYERGTSRDEFTLTDLSGHERRVLAGLLGRRTLAASSMRIRRSELDAALAHAGIAVTLREALEFLDGPLSDRRADRAARERTPRGNTRVAGERR